MYVYVCCGRQGNQISKIDSNKKGSKGKRQTERKRHVELYVWMAMGKEQFKSILINNDATAGPEKLAFVTKTFHSVSIRSAKCSTESDKEKVLAIIESSYASLKAFDKHTHIHVHH